MALASVMRLAPRTYCHVRDVMSSSYVRFGRSSGVSGGGGVSEVRVPEDGVLHDAAAFGR